MKNYIRSLLLLTALFLCEAGLRAKDVTIYNTTNRAISASTLQVYKKADQWGQHELYIPKKRQTTWRYLIKAGEYITIPRPSLEIPRPSLEVTPYSTVDTYLVYGDPEDNDWAIRKSAAIAASGGLPNLFLGQTSNNKVVIYDDNGTLEATTKSTMISKAQKTCTIDKNPGRGAINFSL